MWETLHNNADWHCFKTLILQEVLKARSQGRLDVNITWNSVHFRKSHVRVNKLDMHETDFCFTQFYGSWGDLSRCRITHGWDFRSRSLTFFDWSISFLFRANHQNQRCQSVTEKSVGNSSIKHAKSKSLHENLSGSNQHWSRFIMRNVFWFQWSRVSTDDTVMWQM